MIEKGITYVLTLIALTAVLSAAGCTAPTAKDNTTLAGKDVFDPSKFSMATYVMATSDNQSTGLFTVLAYPGEEGGDRLSSVLVSDNASSRMDVWLNRSHEGVNNATMTLVDGDGMRSVAMPKALSMTTMDDTWNGPGSTYARYGMDSVTVPAGTYENCTIYYGAKHVQYADEALDVEVMYYVHESSPVPVLYMVKTEDGSVAYALRSVYGPDDIDSTPERAVQSYFDRISSGEYTRAARLLVKAEGSGLKPMDGASIAGLGKNMSMTYGTAGEKTAVQYVFIDNIRSAGTIGGSDAITVHWRSIHYTLPPGEVYYIEGTFNMADDEGWKIIV